MKQTEAIDVRTMREKAKKSEDHEAFKVLAKTRNCRIGIGARLESAGEPVFFIEVLVSLCAGHGPVELSVMERKLSLLRRLEERRYSLNCEEDGCVSCELAVPSKNLSAECEAANSIMKECLDESEISGRNHVG